MSSDNFIDELLSINDKTLFANPRFNIAYEFIYKVETLKYYLKKAKKFKSGSRLQEILPALNDLTGKTLEQVDLDIIRHLRNSLAHDPSYVLHVMQDDAHLKEQMKVVDTWHILCRHLFIRPEEIKGLDTLEMYPVLEGYDYQSLMNATIIIQPSIGKSAMFTRLIIDDKDKK